MNGAVRPAEQLLARGVVAATLQLVHAMRDGTPAATVHALMRERQCLLAQLARKMNDPCRVGSLAALQAAVAESDRTLGALLG